ncbi:MAG: recombinase family protein, partial [Candidatus Gottesmanbacteria bacterium]|nr:recombinase family protein [Candidatus Gottesmanbacteria bacterium]
MNSAPSQPFFLYARKSTDVEDMQALSIESQLAELREYAARENISIVEELVEKQSAKIPGRPIFNDMISRIEKGEASGIVSWHPDRLARNSVDGGKLIYLVDTGKIKFLKFPQFWFESTPQGKFMLNIAFGQSKYFVDSLSENTKRGLRQKVRRGELPSLAPVGYLNDPRTKTIVVDQKRAPIIKQVFAMFATGKYRIMDIADFLATNGLVSRNNKSYRIDRVSYQILSNPFYYGHFRYAGEIHEGTHEPLITKQLFDEVQEVWRRKSHSWHEARPVKLYMGLFHCGQCGMMITGEQKTKFYKGTNHTVTYIYYRCSRKSKTIACRQSFVREEELDRQLSVMLQTVALRKDWATKMMEKLETEKTDVAQSTGAFLSGKREEIKFITIKLQRLLDSYLDQDIDRDMYRIKKAELLSRKKTLEEQISRFQKTHQSWLGPMKQWIQEASTVEEIARGEDKNAKKVLAQKIFGSD